MVNNGHHADVLTLDPTIPIVRIVPDLVFPKGKTQIFRRLAACYVKYNIAKGIFGKAWKRNSSDLERLGKKLGAVVMHYCKLYFSFNSPTCAAVSVRIGSERSIRNSLAVSSSSSVAYCALASEVPATTGPWLASSTA
jgi:hypothetical protein